MRECVASGSESVDSDPFGRHVIPHFKSPRNFMRPAEDVMADIREMRNQARALGIYPEGEDGRKAPPAASAAR